MIASIVAIALFATSEEPVEVTNLILSTGTPESSLTPQGVMLVMSDPDGSLGARLSHIRVETIVVPAFAKKTAYLGQASEREFYFQEFAPGSSKVWKWGPGSEPKVVYSIEAEEPDLLRVLEDGSLSEVGKDESSFYTRGGKLQSSTRLERGQWKYEATVGGKDPSFFVIQRSTDVGARAQIVSEGKIRDFLGSTDWGGSVATSYRSGYTALNLLPKSFLKEPSVEPTWGPFTVESHAPWQPALANAKGQVKMLEVRKSSAYGGVFASKALAVNAQGIVVGSTVSKNGEYLASEAVVWQNGKCKFVSELFPRFGTRLKECVAISDTGQVLAVTEGSRPRVFLFCLP